MRPIHPPIAPLQALLGRLEAAGIPAALGGSGLLCAHGLVEKVNDWDLTTDAPSAAVERALEGLTWEDRTSPDRFGTERRCVILTESIEIDLMCSFAIPGEAGTCRMPTLVTGQWQGIPLGSLEVWAAAYWLMGRTVKAELTLDYLRRSGADPARLERILQEPLPAALRAELEGLR